MKSHIKKTAQISSKVIYIKLSIAVLLLLPLVVFTFVTSKSDILAHIRSMVVLSGSMTPNIPVGSVVYVQKAHTYTIGDVISFSNPAGITVTHRIVEIVDNDGIFYRTKGDANRVADQELVPYTSVIGKNVFSLPYLGYAINFLKTPKGFILTIVVPILIFIGFELWNIKREIERSVEKRVLENLKSQKTLV